MSGGLPRITDKDYHFSSARSGYISLFFVIADSKSIFFNQTGPYLTRSCVGLKQIPLLFRDQSPSDWFVYTDYLLAFPSPSHFCLLILFLIIIADMRLKLSSKCLFS